MRRPPLALLLLPFALIADTAQTFHAHERISLEVGTVTVWLGMTHEEITFTTELMGDGLTDDGDRMYFTKYQSSSRKILYETWIPFNSLAKAQKKIHDLLAHSAKNLRDNPEFDKDGHQVGRRVLVLNGVKDRQETEVILAWNNGSKYQEIRSSSLEDVLVFEKQFRAPTKQNNQISAVCEHLVLPWVFGGAIVHV